MAHITVIPKPEKDPNYCVNYRPISLINIDLKLFAKMLAERLKPLLPKIIHTDQAGFVSGREARDNTLKTVSLIHHAKKTNTPLCIISVDAEKAFDRVHWLFLELSLRQLGLGDSYMNKILSLYHNPSARIRVNGTLSDAFKIANEHTEHSNRSLHGEINTPKISSGILMARESLLLPFQQPEPAVDWETFSGLSKKYVRPGKELNLYMKNLRFRTLGGEEVFINKDKNSPVKFEILNFVIWSNSSKETKTVGYYYQNADISQIHIDRSAIHWNPFFTQTPTSVCSPSCLPGYHKIPMEGFHRCCYACRPCPEGEITNRTDMERCVKCPDDEWPNERRDSCIPRSTEFLSYEDTLGLGLAVVALLFYFATTVVFGIFMKYKGTAIVRANNQNLSFILLLSLSLSFLFPLLFIGRPTKMSCLLRQVTFGIVFTISVSSVLAKTVTVILAFRATKQNWTLRRWLGRHFSISLLIICSSVQVVICVFWLTFSPPFPEHNTQVEVGEIILQCNEGSTTAFYIVIGYMGGLAILSFFVAFLARKLPDTFNEAQYITFSMLVFCSVWISFIPAYLSTKGKYMVAVEVFSIFASSAGLLGCFFTPKCYIILMRPELNTRSKLNMERKLKHPS
ncbi:vomeronasal type-2 receptor 26-like [Hyperolius riggenbachi]|uniref:vomeronasal type-2 receptor 26-like n=1 Tax=Hyperolius riggenbachi TaxID=752182 RepID=UPI0035A32525